MFTRTADVKEFIGKVALKVERGDRLEHEMLRFTFDDGTVYEMVHDQDCCESVRIEEIEGDLEYLEEVPILSASEDTNSENGIDGDDDSFTWTFYNFQTQRGHVQIRWYGSSNGYYSESVTVYQYSKTRP